MFGLPNRFLWKERKGTLKLGKKPGKQQMGIQVGCFEHDEKDSDDWYLLHKGKYLSTLKH